MLLAYLVRQLRIFCPMNLVWIKLLLGGCHVYWHRIKSAPGYSHDGKTRVFDADPAAFFERLQTKEEFRVHHLSLWERDNPFSGNIPSNLLRWMSFHRQKSRFFWIQKALYLLTIFEKATLSMESTRPKAIKIKNRRNGFDSLGQCSSIKILDFNGCCE